MRLPYVPPNPSFSSDTDAAILSRVQARRGGTLLPLDRALLHSPAVADGWNSFLGAIRTGTGLSAAVRETAICRVAVLNRAWFEWEHHRPILEESGEVDTEAVEALLDIGGGEGGKEGEGRGGKWNENGVLNEKLRCVVEYTDAMTKKVVVPERTFGKLKEWFNEKEIVELTATVAAYNCVSRFLVALDVDEMAEKHGLDGS